MCQRLIDGGLQECVPRGRAYGRPATVQAALVEFEKGGVDGELGSIDRDRFHT